MKLTHAELLKLLHYNPETGIFTNRITRSSRAMAGEIAGSEQNYGYWWIFIRGKRYMAHRLAWFYVTEAWPLNEIDHINGAKGDNRFANLRDVSRSENALNRGPNINNYLQEKCIYEKGNKFCVQITRDGVRKHVGYFDTLEDAIKARDEELFQ